MPCHHRRKWRGTFAGQLQLQVQTEEVMNFGDTTQDVDAGSNDRNTGPRCEGPRSRVRGEVLRESAEMAPRALVPHPGPLLVLVDR
jgi:hypothetical protein